DAVLSAVISAWLGWQRLVVALIVGFIAGTIMGMIFLLDEMRKADLLRQCYKPLVIGLTAGFLIMAVPLYALGSIVGVMVQPSSWITAGLLGSVGGGLLGVVSVGTRVSKPFPFGPALCLGAVVAIFWDPVGAMLSGGA
ncbi:MAG: hypothetical protein HY711_03140, partial [Candidatus Melainabacteria bacterium]|nr:hypothetical protein [Candidatus Melainabacteria bacterium]